MTGRVVTLPIKTRDDPEFARIARPLQNPAWEKDGKAHFYGGFAGFEIGRGPTVDISVYYTDEGHEPHDAGFDRHLDSEELWIALEGDFYMPAAPCRRPGDLDEVPPVEEMHCFLVREGDLFVLKPNVWHAGVWPVIPEHPVRFMMLLSGHRLTADGNPVDNAIRFVPDTSILPDFAAHAPMGR